MTAATETLAASRDTTRVAAPGLSLSSDARSWFLTTVAAVLSINLLFSRYLFWDSFYDLYAGRYIARHGIPQHNDVTVAAHGAAWVDQQWLAHLAYYGAWVAGGYAGLAALSALLVTCGFALLALLMLRRGVPPVRAFAWTLAALVACMGNTVIRAQSFGYLLCAVLLWLLLDDADSSRLRLRTLWVLPLLVVWANMHGSVLMGIALVCLYAAYRVVLALRQRRRRSTPHYLALAGAAMATVLCTPYGFGIVHYYTSLIGNRTLARNIVEWGRPGLGNPYSWGFFLLALATSAALLLAWRRGTRPDLLLSVFTVALLALAFTGVRFQAWFALAAALLSAETVARSNGHRVPALADGFRRTFLAGASLVAVASIALLALTPTHQFESKVPRRAIDVAAHLATTGPSLRILGDEWSGTTTMWLHPATLGRVGFDARLEQYADSDLNAYFDFLHVRGPRWQRVLSGYDVVVASSQQNPTLAHALAHLPGWRVAYRDADGIVITRA